MKIRSIRISNILSFEHHENIADAQEITFNDGLNILIGPNGSGKSNFLEIINELLRKALFRESVYDEQNTINYKVNPTNLSLRNTLTLSGQNVFSLKKHSESIHETKQVEIILELSEYDKENLNFIQNNVNKINELFRDYTNQPPPFNTDVLVSELQSANSIKLLFKNSQNKNVLELESQLNPLEFFIFNYLQWFEFIQNIITIANNEKNIGWKPLKNSFAIIGSYRNFNQMDPNFSFDANWTEQLSTIKRKVRSDSTRISNNDEPAIFLRIKSKLSDALSRKELEMSKDGIKNPDGKTPLDLLQDPVLDSINKLLRQNLSLYLHVERTQQRKLTYGFSFKDVKNNDPVEIADLSAGEKGIIHFIFSIFAPDLKDGLLIIDEPEIHLHPQMQKKCMSIIEYAQKDLNLQCIVATHSPVFITPETINSVYRFYKPTKFTKVVHPLKITASDKDLINILNYTNSSKIFFVDQTVLVEGPSDEYFYKFFLDHYKKNDNIEFLDIGGKKSFSTWKEFLEKYGLSVYFIADLDNVFEKDLEIIDDSLLLTMKSVFNAESYTVSKLGTDLEYEDSREYRNDLLNHVKQNQIQEWKKIEPKIISKYSDKIFILKEGELEDYVGIKGRKKKLEKIIDFCKNNFSKWNLDEVYSTRVQELRTIFDTIIT
ncbi:conserved protein of unknown function [Nitrosotalea devaniterrae]|uniref:Uncharacterized protein n=1 Tax=Nitrosotalea devaniterrae TaxID=1078905 RepID=A0A128A2N1_9ARCH|nr:conserved protein of unknown function [Candidatus Nitrosotalea devanaterra]